MMKMKTKMKRYSVTYQKLKVRIPYPRNPRLGTCVACGRTKESGEIKVTQLHHTTYAHKKTKVKKNPLLALDNTLELCFFDHMTADGLRLMLVMGSSEKLKHPKIILRVAKLLPKEQLVSLESFCKMFLEYRRGVKQSKTK